MSSKIGWIVAGVIVLVVGGVIIGVICNNMYSTTDPTEDTTAAGALDYQDVAVPITTVVPAEPGGSGNAADDYQKAIEIVKPLYEKAVEDNSEHPQTILDKTAADIGTWYPPQVGKPVNRAVNPEGLELMEKIAAFVAQGATKKEMKYPFNLEKMEVTFLLPEAKYFQVVSQALSDYAHYQVMVLKKNEEAQKIIFNRFIMGWHMSHDRVYPYFVVVGLEVQAHACHWLGDSDGLYPNWPGHEGQAEKAQTYVNAIQDVETFFSNKNKYMFSRFTRENELPNPGDLFNVVQNDKDPCWRVQGLFSLGILKYSSALINSDHLSGDSKRRQSLIDEKLKNGTDEEKAAARAAEKFTKDDYTNLASKNANY